MKYKFNDKGQALVMVLFFSLIASLMILAVLYMVMRGTAMSGMQKRYQTSLDAGYAGVAVETRFLKQGSYKVDDPMLIQTFSVNPVPGTCVYQKLYFSYDRLTTNGWAGCLANQVSMDAADPGGADVIMQVKRADTSVAFKNDQFDVYQKIVDSRRGLTAQRPPGVELPTGVAYGSETGLDLQPQAYFYYAVEIKAVDAQKGEVARISFDYAW